MNTYIDIFNHIPETSTKIIKKSIDLYAVIKKKEIKIDIKGRKTKKRLTYEDKANISIFISCITINSDVKDIFIEQEINDNAILTYLNLPYDIKLEAKELSDEEYQKYIKLDFQNIIRYIIPENKNYSLVIPERIMYEQRWNRVVEEFFKKYELIENGPLSLSPIFEEIKDLLSDKEIEIKEEFNISDDNFENNIVLTEINKNTSLNDINFKIEKHAFNNNPSIERSKEIEYILLSIIKDKSIMLVGATGTGKDSLIKGIDYLIQENKLPKYLKNLKIKEETVINLLSSCPTRVILEQKINELINYLISNKDTILYIKDLYQPLTLKLSNGRVIEIINMLKPFLDNKDIKLITTITKNEFNKYIEEDYILTNNMEIINIEEPPHESLERIILSKIDEYAIKYKINFNLSQDKLNNLVKDIIYLTDKKNRKEESLISNPKLSLSIIEDMFAYSIYESNSTISTSNIISSINKYTNVYDSVKNNVINKIKNNNN